MEHDVTIREDYREVVQMSGSENDRLRLMVRHLLSEKRRYQEELIALDSGSSMRLKGN